jgi:hypothetical protein
MPAPPPPDVLAAAAIVERWTTEQEAAARARAHAATLSEFERMTPEQRFEAIRMNQAAAAREGRTLPVPSAPAPVTAAPDPARMSASERWAHMRAHDQSKMPAWRDPRG